MDRYRSLSTLIVLPNLERQGSPFPVDLVLFVPGDNSGSGRRLTGTWGLTKDRVKGEW